MVFYFILSVWLISGIKKLRSKEIFKESLQSFPEVSIVIAARNEEKNIKQCLEKCIAQEYPLNKYEIIVINDRSEDKTKQIIKEFVKESNNVHLINIEELPAEYSNSGKKHALKQGIEKAKGDIILLTDADCQPEPGWIKVIIKYFEKDVGVVVGHSPIKEKGFINRLVQLDNLSIFAVGAGGIGGGYPILSAGRNFAYRRQVFYEIGGFEQIKDFSSGDDDLILMLVRENTNWKISFASDPQSFVYTYPPNNLKTAIKQRMRWASKGMHYTVPMTLSLVAVFFYNLFLFITIPLYFVNLFQSPVPIYSFIIKAIGDFIIIYHAAKLLNESHLIRYFPIAALLHIPYLLFFGLYGTFGKVQWKTNDN